MDRCTLNLLKPFNIIAIRVLSSPKTPGYAECFKIDKTLLLIYQSLHNTFLSVHFSEKEIAIFKFKKKVKSEKGEKRP